jgi:hypothetical protein
MSTTNQIESNRLNAQKSTGPRTDAGKAVSRFNALKSGIDAQAEVIPGEDPANLLALLAEYRERHDASTPERRMIVDILVNCEWMLRRLRRGEAEFWKFQDDKTFSNTDFPEGRLIDYGDKVYDRLQRRINSIQRNYLRCLAELRTLEITDAVADQPPDTPAPPPEPPATTPPEPDQPASNQQPVPPTGFVPRFPCLAPQPDSTGPLDGLLQVPGTLGKPPSGQEDPLV